METKTNKYASWCKHNIYIKQLKSPENNNNNTDNTQGGRQLFIIYFYSHFKHLICLLYFLT